MIKSVAVNLSLNYLSDFLQIYLESLAASCAILFLSHEELFEEFSENKTWKACHFLVGLQYKQQQQSSDNKIQNKNMEIDRFAREGVPALQSHQIASQQFRFDPNQNMKNIKNMKNNFVNKNINNGRTRKHLRDITNQNIDNKFTTNQNQNQIHHKPALTKSHTFDQFQNYQKLATKNNYQKNMKNMKNLKINKSDLTNVKNVNYQSFDFMECKKNEIIKIEPKIVTSEVIYTPRPSLWDAPNVGNENYVTEYMPAIMDNLREAENNFTKYEGMYNNNNKCNFFAFHTDINQRMRTILVDWMIDVARKFQLQTPTVFLSISLLDRYLSKTPEINRKKLQLAGCACLWIASKYHELTVPEMNDFVYISAYSFNTGDLKKYEFDILTKVSFQCTIPTSLNFIERYIQICGHYVNNPKSKKMLGDLIMFCAEHCMMSINTAIEKPSLVAASCFVYATFGTKVLNQKMFKNDRINQEIGYELRELIPMIKRIDSFVKNSKNSRHKAVHKKYCKGKFSNISKLDFNKLDFSDLKMHI